MRISLFITCFNDTLFPQTGRATVQLLERLGHSVDFPREQTCCGQMHYNTGYQREAIPLVRHFVDVFADSEVVVAPSASCVGMIRELYPRAAELPRMVANALNISGGTAMNTEHRSNTGNNARDAILTRIRAALQDVPPDERPEQIVVERNYRFVDTEPREEIIERFIERVTEYKATVRRVEEDALPAAIAAACTRRNVRRLVVPADLPASWIPADVEQLRDNEQSLTYQQLDRSDGVLTGCALGIAQTGTIVLDSGAMQGRRVLTLLPDYALCVIREEQVVGLVPEAITRLGEAERTQGRPLTFISGPSATSDIELSRVEGVHGPRTLEVLVVRTSKSSKENQHASRS